VNNPSKVPEIIDKCINFLQAHVTLVGLFRISCKQLELDSLIETINTTGIIDFTNIRDSHVVSACLKKYFRDLPDPLLVSSKYNTYLTALSEQDDKKQVLMKEVIDSLPEINLTTLKVVIKFLVTIAANGEENKMSSANLAIVFGPTLMWVTTDDAAALFAQTQKVSQIVKELIDHHQFYFP